MGQWLVLPAMIVFALILDFIWIAKIANKFYLDAFATFGRIVEGRFVPILWAAVVVYLIIPIAVYVFVVLPAQQQSLLLTVLKGALLGFCLYGVYDFTNLATIQDWTVKVSLVDVAWGTFLCAACAAFGRIVLDQTR